MNRKAEIYGPHRDPFAMPMLHHTGLTPVESPHMTGAALCGSCHTVVTPTLGPDGCTTGVFLEQAPYLKWLAGDFARAGTTCQSCHVPVLRESSGAAFPQYIAHMPPGRWFPPTHPRTPFGLHFFAGANVSMADLPARTEPENATALRRTAAKAGESLRSALSLRASAAVERRKLRVAVELRNRTGHKLPTGFPSRRLWLHVQVVSADGSRIFESGGWDESGNILRAGGSFEPHRSRITRPDQAMVYQAVMVDTAGVATTSLLRAASYLKDNRIPPSGFNPAADPRLASVGTSGGAGFRPGEHRLEYEIALSGRADPVRVHVEAVYQSIDPAYLPAADSAALRPATTPVVIASSDLSLRSRKMNPLR